MLVIMLSKAINIILVIRSVFRPICPAGERFYLVRTVVSDAPRTV
jgi:hypothetical protein